jgi:Ca2+-binding EF-hand superfamily protein
MSQLTQEELKSCRVFFNNFDRNRTGTINGWELQIALEAMNANPSEEQIQTILQQLGAEANGTLGK